MSRKKPAAEAGAFFIGRNPDQAILDTFILDKCVNTFFFIQGILNQEASR